MQTVKFFQSGYETMYPDSPATSERFEPITAVVVSEPRSMEEINSEFDDIFED